MRKNSGNFLFREKKQFDIQDGGGISFSYIFTFYVSCDNIVSRYLFMVMHSCLLHVTDCFCLVVLNIWKFSMMGGQHFPMMTTAAIAFSMELALWFVVIVIGIEEQWWSKSQMRWFKGTVWMEHIMYLRHGVAANSRSASHHFQLWFGCLYND